MTTPWQQATCVHPSSMRSTLHGFGQREQDVRKFFCRACQQEVDLDRLESQRLRNELIQSEKGRADGDVR